MIENSILRNGTLLWKVRLFPVKSSFHQPLINTSISTYTILPRNGENVLYYPNIFNSKLSLPLSWTKGELREPICGDELWRTPEIGAEQARQNPSPTEPMAAHRQPSDHGWSDHCTRSRFGEIRVVAFVPSV